MKVIKDAMMKWLDDEIYKEANDQPTPTRSRYDVLMEVKTKLSEIIVEEFVKLTENNNEKL